MINCINTETFTDNSTTGFSRRSKGRYLQGKKDFSFGSLLDVALIIVPHVSLISHEDQMLTAYTFKAVVRTQFEYSTKVNSMDIDDTKIIHQIILSSFQNWKSIF